VVNKAHTGRSCQPEITMTDQKLTTIDEIARELFVAGYRQALDDMAQAAERSRDDEAFLTRLRTMAAPVHAGAALAEAIKGDAA
jgi:hypothetical protein